MMKTTKCDKCSAVSQVWSSVRVWDVKIVTCSHCQDRERSAQSQSFIVANTFGTKTAFVPDTISR
jgi:RNase P subunit RPR2